jgi:Mrp family chromosome partitioning ATPase
LSNARGEAFDQSPNRVRQKQLNDQVESLRSLYAELSKHMDRARLASELCGTSNLNVKDIAVPPEGPVSPKKSIALVASMMLFGLVSLGLPVSIGLARDHVMPLLTGTIPQSSRPVAPPIHPATQATLFQPAPAPTISHIELPRHASTVQSSQTQVLASIPELMAGEGPIQLSELLHPAPINGGNAVNQIATLLEKHRSQRRGSSVLLITSANPGEGKSLLASALAAALCTASRSVFLMECNPAAPSIQNWFPQAEGYSSWTNDLETLRYGQSNLFLLPAHDLPSYEMSDLIDGYRAWIGRANAQGLDWVIIDGASLLRGFADVAQLAPMATDILFVHDSTRCDADQVKAALNLLRPLAVNDAMRGMVLNRQTTCAA